MHRRFVIWSLTGVWGRLHQEVLQLLDERDLVDLSPRGTRLSHVRAKKRGASLQVRAPWTGVSRVSKMHVLSHADGLPLRAEIAAANTHDSQALKPMLSHFHMGHESHAAESKPQRLHADKAYDVPHLRKMAMGHVLADRLPQTQPPLRTASG